MGQMTNPLNMPTEEWNVTLSSSAMMLFPVPRSDARAYRISQVSASESTVRVLKTSLRLAGQGTDTDR